MDDAWAAMGHRRPARLVLLLTVVSVCMSSPAIIDYRYTGTLLAPSRGYRPARARQPHRRDQKTRT